MKKKKEKTDIEKIKKTGSIKTVFWSVVIALILAAVMAAIANSLVRFVKVSIHNERTVYLTTQTETITRLIDETVSQYSDYADVCASIISDELVEGDNIYAFIDSVQQKLFLEGARLILVDESATWYGENGTNGRITAVSKYESRTEDKEIYITTGVDSIEESFVCRNRLEAPIAVDTGSGTVNICYCAVVCYMDRLQEQVNLAFPLKSNRFIIDGDGLMLYKSFELGILMSGTNIFSKYDRVSFLFGDTGAEQVGRIRADETTVAEFEVQGTNYFICTAPMGINDWHITYVLESDALSAGDYIKTMIFFILGITLVFAVAVTVAVLMFFRILVGQRQLAAQREMNVYLEQAAKAKSDFLSNMSHDIRTPLNGIMGMTMLAMREKNPPHTTDCLKNIDNSAKYLLDLVNDVLDMSSIENSKVTLNLRPRDVRTVPEECASIIRGQMQGRELELITDFGEITRPHVMVDDLRLHRILINLLSNAVKYTPDGGKIWFTMKELSCEKDTCRIRFVVEDTGIGMKREYLDRIWDAFSQEEGGSRTVYKGTGLGMAITKNYVDLMNGTIRVKSVYEKGSVFTVEIPFEIDRDFEPEKPEEGEPCSIRGCRILLAEDNSINRLIAREILEDEGAVLTEAEDGKKALELFSASKPGDFDILLLDIMMPGLTGFEVSAAIRKMKRPDAKRIPIVAMTANTTAENIRQSKEAGMNAHLTKPMDIPVVMKTLSDLYRSGRGEKQ